MKYEYIETQQVLDDAIAYYSQQVLLAVDTEFMRRRTLFPEIALIQVYGGERLALIDPLSDLDLSGFWQLMQDESIVKVLHSPSEDIEVFMRHGNCVPKPLFDTQFALSVLDVGASMGFAHMVKHFLDIEVDKSESKTNWLQRPLTNRQRDYAAADVYYLMPCYLKLKELIEAKELLEVVYSESEQLAIKRNFRTPDERLYLDVKNSWKLAPAELVVLKELASWRKNKAVKKNLALSFILKEPTLFEIAKHQPSSLTQLKHIQGIERIEVQRSGKEIIACIEQAKLASDLPHPIKRLIDFSNYKKCFKEIKSVVSLASRRTGIPEHAIASKKQINAVLSWHWKLSAHEKEYLLTPDLLCGWRDRIMQNELDKWK